MLKMKLLKEKKGYIGAGVYFCEHFIFIRILVFVQSMSLWYWNWFGVKIVIKKQNA